MDAWFRHVHPASARRVGNDGADDSDFDGDENFNDDWHIEVINVLLVMVMLLYVILMLDVIKMFLVM